MARDCVREVSLAYYVRCMLVICYSAHTRGCVADDIGATAGQLYST